MKYWLYIFLTICICANPLSMHAQDAGIDDRVDILWESPDSYTPPFYKGKGLPTDESTIRAVAISGSFNPKTTTYSWTRNGKNISKMSGVNKNAFVFTHDILNNTEDIGVLLRAGGNVANSSAATSVTPTTPAIVVYEKRDGFINYSHGYTSNFDLNYPGTTLRVEPFFFSIPKNPLADLGIYFTLGDITPDTQNIFEIPLLRPTSGGSTSFVSDIQSKKSNWQNAKLTTQINF